MTFAVDGDLYQRWMGRYADLLAVETVRTLGVRREPDGERPVFALDVGAGTGALTAQLVAALGPERVAAVDPSPPFVEALRARLPGVRVDRGTAEDLPHFDAAFDVAVAQLVVSFMSDPVAGLAEMARVTVPGGTVAASVWDFGGGRAPLSLFWRAVHDLDPAAEDESRRPGVRDGDLARIMTGAGLRDVRSGEVTVRLPYADPDDWWQPYTLGVGPAGAYVAGLDDSTREALRRRALELLGPGPGAVEATAWLAVASR